MKKLRFAVATAVILALLAAPTLPVAAEEDSPYIISVEQIELQPGAASDLVFGELLDELTDAYSYYVEDERLIFRHGSSLDLRESGTRQIVIPAGETVYLSFFGLDLDAGDRPAIVVESGARLTIYLREESRLATGGAEPVIQAAPGAMVTVEHGGERNTLHLQDAGHGWHDGTFTVSAGGVYYADPESGGYTAWVPQPAGAEQVENAYLYAQHHNRRPGEALTLELHNYPSLSAEGMRRLRELAGAEGGEIRVVANPPYRDGTPAQLSFSVWPDTAPVAFDLNAHQSTAETLALQETLMARYPGRTCKVIRLGQEGALPVRVELSFIQHLPQIEDASAACVYTYNPADGSVSRLPSASFDSSRYHDATLTTATGGYLVISDGVLSIF